jgi:hypothetical protein
MKLNSAIHIRLTIGFRARDDRHVLPIGYLGLGKLSVFEDTVALGAR